MQAENIQKTLDAAVAAGYVAGVAAAVTSGSETLVQCAAGVTVLGGNQKVGPNTIFWIASMTKPITSLAAMQLVEQGKLSLDAPISDLLPQLANPQILQNGKLRPALQKITLRHLLTHTAGFSYAFASAEYVAYIKANNIDQTPGALASIDMPLLFEPGERWEYGISTDWVGRAVEAASGETLDVYFQKHIFGPLGMDDTSFRPNAEQNTRRAAIHQRQPDGTLSVSPPAVRSKNPEFLSGGGGLHSTLNDYQKFLRMFLGGGAGVIAPESIAEMSKNQIGALRAGYMPSANPSLMSGADVNPGQDSKWGLGFLIYPQKSVFGRHAGSMGWAGLANTYFWIDPAVNQAAVILMQILPSGDAGAIKTLLSFEQAVYAAPR
jgi:CubicO group peptidase (beta-lactamase class C family)